MRAISAGAFVAWSARAGGFAGWDMNPGNAGSKEWKPVAGCIDR
jgi:hypothetical protein